MFDDWPKRYKKYNSHDMFDEVERMIWKILENIKFNFKDSSRVKDKRIDKSNIHDFSISIRNFNKPIVRESENFEFEYDKPIIKEDYEPLIDIIEEGETIKIYIELQGIKRENIKLRLVGKQLIVSALNEDKRYQKKIKLPFKISRNNVRAKFRNGVLEIIINKKGKSSMWKQIEMS